MEKRITPPAATCPAAGVDWRAKKRRNARILDNHGTPNRETVRNWLAGHPRFRLHFTPTGASWLDLVESWFGGLTQHLRRDAFSSVEESVAAVEEYLTRDDTHVGPFVWSTTAAAVLDRVRNRGATHETGG